MKNLVKVLKEIANHKETYDEIKELIFTKEMKQKSYGLSEMNRITGNFFQIKNKALVSVKDCAPLSCLEMFVFYSILFKMADIQITITNRLNMFLDKTNASVKDIINNEKYEIRILYQDIKKYIDIIITKYKL